MYTSLDMKSHKDFESLPQFTTLTHTITSSAVLTLQHTVAMHLVLYKLNNDDDDDYYFQKIYQKIKLHKITHDNLCSFTQCISFQG